MGKRGQDPVRLIMYVQALSAAIILCWTSDYPGAKLSVNSASTSSFK
jgi:hypothetical protein